VLIFLRVPYLLYSSSSPDPPKEPSNFGRLKQLDAHNAEFGLQDYYFAAKKIFFLELSISNIIFTKKTKLATKE
jgi:hypothetical protein